MRLIEELFGRQIFDDLTGIHEDDVIGHFFGKAHFVGNNHHGHTFLGEAHHDVKHFINHFRVKCRGRFVKEHADRIHCECTGNSHTLLLTAGKLTRILFRMLEQTDSIQQLQAAGKRLFAGTAKYLHLSKDQVFLD